MFRKTFLAALALLALAAAPSFATELAGKAGLGYFRPEAPVGGRLWLNDKVGADLGIGFQVSDASGDSRSAFLIDAGLPFVVHSTDKAIFFVRPGFDFASSPEPVTADPDNKLTQFWVSGTLGAEYFFTPEFSIQAAHGIVFKSYDPDQAGDSFTSFGTEDFGISNIGFHYYFGGH